MQINTLSANPSNTATASSPNSLTAATNSYPTACQTLSTQTALISNPCWITGCAPTPKLCCITPSWCVTAATGRSQNLPNPNCDAKYEDAACHQIFVERLLTTSDDNNDFDRLTEQQHNKRYAKRWHKMLEMLEYANN